MPPIIIASWIIVGLLLGTWYVADVLRPRRAARREAARIKAEGGVAVVGTLSRKRPTLRQVSEWVAVAGDGGIEFSRRGALGLSRVGADSDGQETFWWLPEQRQIRVEPRGLLFRADRDDLADLVAVLRAMGCDVREHRGYGSFARRD